MYKKYIPEEKINFKKSMKTGPGYDNFGILPLPYEVSCCYRKF